MGGLGSGGHPKGLPRPKAERCDQLDVRRLRHAGLFGDGPRTGFVRWTGRGGVPMQMRVESTAQSLSLELTGAGGGQARFRLEVERTPGGFAGQHVWFCCPVCRRRCRVVYLAWSRFGCRRCQRVVYACENMEPADRAFHRAAKAWAKFGETDFPRTPTLPLKPKGMHWRTYERLLGRARRLQERWERLSLASLEREAQAFERDMLVRGIEP